MHQSSDEQRRSIATIIRSYILPALIILSLIWSLTGQYVLQQTAEYLITSDPLEPVDAIVATTQVMCSPLRALGESGSNLNLSITLIVREHIFAHAGTQPWRNHSLKHDAALHLHRVTKIGDGIDYFGASGHEVAPSDH